jgi:hypothetical protein
MNSHHDYSINLSPAHERENEASFSFPLCRCGLTDSEGDSALNAQHCCDVVEITFVYDEVGLPARVEHFTFLTIFFAGTISPLRLLEYRERKTVAASPPLSM